MMGGGLDPRVREDFKAAIDRALDDPETKETLEDLAGRNLDVSVHLIRADLVGSREAILGRTRTMLTAWELALDRQREAVTSVMRRLFGREFWWVLAAAVALTILSSLFVPAFRWWTLLILAAPVGFVSAQWTLVFELLPYVTNERRAFHRFIASLDTQMTIAVREAVNVRLTSFKTTFEIIDRRGLRQLADPDREVPTGSAEALEALISSLDSGSIGLAGPRGCGKTTLIRSFTEGRSLPFSKQRIGLTVAAPVRYDPRDFILHLFASLCEEVLKNRPQALLQGGARWAQARRRRWMWVVGALALGFGIAGAILWTGVQAPAPRTIGIILASVGGTFAIGWLAAWVGMNDFAITLIQATPAWPALPLIEITRSTNVSYEAAAKDYLKQIRFQQSQEAGGSAEVGLPLGGGLGLSTSTTLARTPWSLPEAVAEFRRFASSLSRRFVVIGIDELDKMESDVAAREFLNNVKGVFGVEGCYFLVSVSEDAMSAFERRGLPMRDVFDSSFDEIQRIGYLSLAESRGVLESRVTGVPVSFQCLCHCLAGGLPRDLIRAIRELVYHYDAELAEEGGKDVSLANLARLLVTAEWEGKVAGAIAAARSMDAMQPWWLSCWLHEMDGQKPDSASLKRWTAKLGSNDAAWAKPIDEAAARFTQLAVEMMAFNYYAATLLDFFCAEGIGGDLEDPAKKKKMRADQGEKLETLAKARQQFATDPRLSWKLVEQARCAADLTKW